MTISQQRAIDLFAAHQFINPRRELIALLGLHSEYDATEVMHALGYGDFS